jgi:hypothetical protein
MNHHAPDNRCTEPLGMLEDAGTPTANVNSDILQDLPNTQNIPTRQGTR